MPAILASRVVAVVADLDTGMKQIGSGYLLDAGRILTARHCARDKVTGRRATALRVVRATDGAVATVAVSADSPSLDVALLVVDGVPPWAGEPPLDPVRFERLNRDRSGRLHDCEAAGYPLWQRSELGDYRDLAELHGSVYVMEGRESQRLVMRDPTLDGVGWQYAGDAPGGQPAWSGLSGAAVFHDGLLLGVVIEHHRRQGPSAVQIRPVEAIASATDQDSVRLAAALGLEFPDSFRSAGPDPVASVLDEYLRFHVARCTHIDPRGLRRTWHSQGMMLPLTDIYSAARLGLEGSDEIAADQAITLSGSRSEAITDDLADDLLVFEDFPQADGESFAGLIADRRWLVVLGDPGAGKTTLLKWLTLMNARALLARHDVLEVAGRHVGLPDQESVTLGPVRLPVLVRVADYADELAKRKAEKKSLPGIYEFLGSHRLDDEALPGDTDSNVGLIRQYLRAGRVLVLLDGLDEITDSSMRELIARRIEQFIRDHVPDPAEPGAYLPDTDGDAWWKVAPSRPAIAGGNQVIVTSRRAGYKEAPLSGQVTTTKILPLGDDAIRRFIADWCLATERYRAAGISVSDDEIESKAASAAEVLAGEILADPRIGGLAANPLLLTMLAFVREELGSLPTRRAELYERATSVLAHRRQTGGWTASEMVTILGPFALWLQERSNKGFATVAVLRENARMGLARIRENVTTTDLDVFVRAAREQAGLLVETGADRYGFMHATFREYLAAREIARSPGRVESYVERYLHVPRWAETLRLCAAVTSASRPDSADTMLGLFLDHGSPQENVLHRDLLFAASCLQEMENVTPALAGAVIDRLLDAAAWAIPRWFGRLTDRLVEVLVALAESHPHTTLPRLCASLRAVDDTATVAVRVACRLRHPTIELLSALEHTCCSSHRPLEASQARKEVAQALLDAGSLDDDAYQPVGTLLQKHEGTLARLHELWPTAVRLLRSNAEFLHPDLREAYQWLLEQTRTTNDGAALRRAFTAELLARARADDSDFLMLWSTARVLDRVTADRWLIESYTSGSADRDWVARCLAHYPAAFPGAWWDLEQWFENLPVSARRTLLEYQAQSRGPSPLVPLAWRYISGGYLAEASRVLLCRQSVRTGWLRGSPAAFEALSEMLTADSSADNAMARALLSRLVKSDSLAFSQLQSLVREHGTPLCRVLAAILLLRSGLRVSAQGYDLVAEAIADRDGPLRDMAVAGLRPRDCHAVEEQAILRSWHHRAERLAAGDGAGASAHAAFGMKVIHDDASHFLHLAAIVGKKDQLGGVTGEAANVLMAQAGELPEKELLLALEACRLSTREGNRLGIDLASIARLCDELQPGEPRTEAAQLLAEEAILTRSWPAADQTARGFIASGDLASATVMLRAAAWQLALDDESLGTLLDGLLATRDELAGNPMDEAESRAYRAAALLLDSARNLSDPDVDSLPRVSGVGEAAAAVLDALVSEKSWDHYPALPGSMRARLASIARRIAKHERGMRAVIREVTDALAPDEHWARRRAALYLADVVATGYPALFLDVATPELRRQVIAIADDEESYSVRLLSVNVLSHFRRLDADALGVIARACRDYGKVSAATVLRCQTMLVSEQPDISQIIGLLESEDCPTVMAGAVLLSALARSGSVKSRERDAMADALAAAVQSPNPAMDIMRVRDARSLRSWLHDLLMDLAWRDRQPDVAPMIGWWALEGTTQATPARSAPTADSPASDSIVKQIRELPVLSGSQSPSAPPIRLKAGYAVPSWADLGLGDLPGPQLHHIARALYSALERKVGTILADEMTSAQLDDFMSLIDQGGNGEQLAWLDANLPAYREAVRRNVETVFDELLRTKPMIRRAVRERFDKENPQATGPGGLPRAPDRPPGDLGPLSAPQKPQTGPPGDA